MESTPQELLDVLINKADAYAEKATELSNTWLTIQQRLRDMPGKIACAINVDGHVLSFAKSGNEWWLLFKSKEAQTAEYVTQLPVEWKGYLAAHVGRLIEAMIAEQAERTAYVDRALSLISPFTSQRSGDL